MKTPELLDSYYRALAARANWETGLADDFRFIGGDMTKREAIVGKENYVRIITGLAKRFSGVRVLKTFVDGDEACVLAQYDWTFPRDVNITGNVVELWKVKNGKLWELAIYFDTGNFDKLTKA